MVAARLTSRAATVRVRLLGARVDLDDAARREFLALLDTTLDWPALVQSSRRDGTSALLYRAICDTPGARSAVPVAALETLRRLTRDTWARNALLREAWREAISTLEDARIDVMTLKGMALAQHLYPDPALRPMCDVDLLVRPEQKVAALSLLSRSGYHAADTDERTDTAPRGYVTVVRDRVVIDLRWYSARYLRYARVLRLDDPGMWRRSVRRCLGDVEARVLSLEDDVLYLILHLSLGSEFDRLIWFTDLDATIRAAGARLDWDAVVDRARQWRIAAVTRMVFGMLRTSFDTPIPSGVDRRLDAVPGRQRAAGWLLGGVRPPSLRARALGERTWVAQALLMDRPADIARVMASAFVPPREWVAFHYAVRGPRVTVYRALHPFRALWVGATRLLVPGTSRPHGPLISDEEA